MNLNKREIFCWLCLLIIITAFAFVFSIPSYALDPRIAERLAGYVTENSDIHVIEDVFEKDAYTAGLPLEKNPNRKSQKENSDESKSYVSLILGIILTFKFCSWFYSTFIESAWNK